MQANVIFHPLLSFSLEVFVFAVFMFSLRLHGFSPRSPVSLPNMRISVRSGL